MVKDDWYEKYRAGVEKDAENFKIKEAEQNILHLKAVATCAIDKLKNPEFYYVRNGEQFGFSEKLVNQLMQCSYDYGRKHIDKSSYDTGYTRAMIDVAEKLGMDYET